MLLRRFARLVLLCRSIDGSCYSRVFAMLTVPLLSAEILLRNSFHLTVPSVWVLLICLSPSQKKKTRALHFCCGFVEQQYAFQLLTIVSLFESSVVMAMQKVLRIFGWHFGYVCYQQIRHCQGQLSNPECNYHCLFRPTLLNLPGLQSRLAVSNLPALVQAGPRPVLIPGLSQEDC